MTTLFHRDNFPHLNGKELADIEGDKPHHPGFYSFQTMIDTDCHDEDRMRHLVSEIETSPYLGVKQQAFLFNRLVRNMLRLSPSP